MEKKFIKETDNGVIICTIKTDKYWSVTYEEYENENEEEKQWWAEAYEEYENDEIGYISGGRDHEKIIKHFPNLAKFSNMHLSDSSNGVPMYFQANGIYHLQNSTMETVCKHFRVDLEEARTLFFKMKEDFIDFYKHLSDLTIRYEKENKQLKQELNEL